MRRRALWLAAVAAAIVGLIIYWKNDNYVPSRQFLIDIGDFILFSTAPALVAFSIYYGVRVKWWLNAAGRSILFLVLSLDIVLALVILSRTIGTGYDGYVYIRMFSYTLVSGSLWYLFIALIQAQIRGRQKRKNKS